MKKGKFWEGDVGDKKMKERNLLSGIEKLFVSNYFIIALGVIAILTRFFWINRESIWIDEALSISFAQISGIQQIGTYLFHTTWEDPHPIFYYSVLHYWIKIFGTSEVAIRSLSAIFGILVIMFTYYAGSELIDKKVGILASILVLVNPLNLWYSQEARMYTLTSLLILLSSYFFFKLLISERNITRPILYVLTSVILIYTDYVGIFVLGVHLLFGLFYLIQKERMELKIKTVLLCYAGILMLYLPWIPNLYHKFSTGGAIWMSAPTLGGGARTFIDLIGPGRGVLRSLLPSTISYAFVRLTVLMTLIILVVGIIISLRKKTEFSSLIAMTCFIPVIMFFISITVSPIYNSRQISGFVPEIALMIATGLICAPPLLSKIRFPFSLNKIFVLLFIFMVVMNLSNVYTVYNVDTKDDFRSVAKYIEQNIQSGDIILLNASYAIKPFNYYYNGDVKAKGVSSVEELKVIIPEYERIWLIRYQTWFTDPTGEIPGYLERTTTHEITRKEFTGITVIRYEVP